MSSLNQPIPRVTWGNARWRYGLGLVMIVLGVAAMNLTSTYSLWFAIIGPTLQVLGWLVLPGALWRRLIVIVPGLVAAVVLLAGSDFVGAFAVLLAGWLFARHRPALSYLALIPVIGVSFVLKAALNAYDQNWIALIICTVATLASAWLGWALADWRRLLTGRRVRAGIR